MKAEQMTPELLSEAFLQVSKERMNWETLPQELQQLSKNDWREILELLQALQIEKSYSQVH